MVSDVNLLKIAFSQYGITEWSGEGQHNPEVLKYFKEIGHEWVKDDETAWCSAFVNWVCKKASKQYSGKLNARSWLNVGTETKEPLVGDIVVLTRGNPNSWTGHVGFVINIDSRNIWVLGGNQGNMVKISPYSKDRLLSYRKV